MEAFSTKIAISEYLKDALVKVGVDEKSFVILSLNPGTGLSSILKAIEKAGGFHGITEKKSGEVRYFIVFKNMDEESVVKAIDSIEIFGKCDPTDKSHFVEFALDKFPNRKYYAVRVDFKID